MTHFDVFNGDADGICALLQLRLDNPIDTVLITGVKRDISLLERVQAVSGDNVTVLDVAMKKNQKALHRLLSRQVPIFYCDHHQSGEIPTSPFLTALINTDANVCTSLLINGHLKGRFARWAIAGAFGDNLEQSAIAVAKPLGIRNHELAVIKNTGIYINYNGYGSSLEDLHFKPDELFKILLDYDSPLSFYEGNKAVYSRLEQGYQQDLANAFNSKSYFDKSHAAVFYLPDAPWARRVSGVYGNELANKYPDKAHAVITKKPDGHLLVSVRAPLNNKQGAEHICSQFPTGGGRAAAAGINDLSPEQLPMFIDCFEKYYKY